MINTILKTYVNVILNELVWSSTRIKNNNYWKKKDINGKNIWKKLRLENNL